MTNMDNNLDDNLGNNMDNNVNNHMDSNEAIDLRMKRTVASQNMSYSNRSRSNRNSVPKFKDRKFRGRHANVFKKRKFKYQSSLSRHLRQTSDSGQFGSDSMRGSSITSSYSKQSTSQGETTSSPSSGSGSSNSPHSFEPQVVMGAPTDQSLCMMLGNAVPLIVMMQGQMHTANNGNKDSSYSNTMLFKCNMCDMFSNNITDVLNHVNNNHSDIHHCFVCNQFHRNRKEFDRHKDVCATARQAFQQTMGTQYHSARQSNTTHSNVQSEAVNLSMVGDVAKRATQIVSSKKSRRKKLNTLLTCVYCKKAFFGSFYLQRHLRSHTGEKPCHCDICGKGFAEWRNLRNHMKRFHNGSETTSSRGSQSKSVSLNGTSDSDQGHLKNDSKQLSWLADNYNSSHSTKTVGNYPSLTPSATQPIGNYAGRSVGVTQHSAVHRPDDVTNNLTTQTLIPESAFSQVARSSSPNIVQKTTEANYRTLRNSMPHSSQSSMYGSSYSSSGSYSPSISTRSTSACTYSSARTVDWVSTTKSSSTILIHSLPATKPSKVIKNIDEQSVAQSTAASKTQELRAKNDDVKPGTMYLGSTSSRLELTNELQGHEQSLNPFCNENGEKVYQCHACNKIFRTKFAMQRHLDFHADKRPYECDQCNYRAKTRPQLKVHVMRHSGEKGHTCSICGYSCVTHSDLNRHCKSRSHLFRMSVLAQTDRQQQEQVPPYNTESNELPPVSSSDTPH